MAFENFDKQAVAEMAKAYDKSQQTKIGFWGGLFSLLETLSRSDNSSSTENGVPKERGITGIEDHPSIFTSSHNYSPHVGLQDWD